mgnify:CR=1 FL=1|jgi:site-specific DNA-methyltransferase (adenine-specific)
MKTIINEDSFIHLKTLDENTFDSCVTDPPYELGFMGKSWDGTGIAFNVDFWKEVLRTLKPGSHLIAFSASRNYHRMAVAIEDAGFEIRDQIMWIYGSGFPKGLNLGKAIDKKQGNDREDLGNYKTPEGNQELSTYNNWKDGEEQERRTPRITKGNSEWEGWGTALKPAHEPIVLARKPLSEKSIVENVLKHGTGGINIDECRIETYDVKNPETNQDFKDVGKKSKEAGFQDKLSFGQVSNAKRIKVKRQPRNKDRVWTEENSGMKAEGTEFADADPKGRYPANVIHDGSEEVQEIFPDTAPSKASVRNNNNTESLLKKGFKGKPKLIWSGHKDKGSASRFFYVPKAHKKEREESKHPTIKPVELMKYLVRLITPKGGTVLDPFAGTGTTGEAAIQESCSCYLIEKENEYIKDIETRLNKYNEFFMNL